MNKVDTLARGQILAGPLFNEPMRVDPLPHQLEAVDDHLLELARVRFLLADDAGAGKTIMSGLLIRELELRGLAERILIVCPANLAFQWQRELKEQFDAKFLVAIAMRAVLEHEQAQGRQVYDVSEKNLGYDVTSLDLASGDLRLIEVKGLGAATGTILLTPNERRVAEGRPDCFWLYVVTDCDNAPRLQEPIRGAARLDWNEVTKVAHYYLSANAMTMPMQVREQSPDYGRSDG